MCNTHTFETLIHLFFFFFFILPSLLPKCIYWAPAVVPGYQSLLLGSSPSAREEDNTALPLACRQYYGIQTSGLMRASQKRYLHLPGREEEMGEFARKLYFWQSWGKHPIQWKIKRIYWDRTQWRRNEKKKYSVEEIKKKMLHERSSVSNTAERSIHRRQGQLM